MNPSTVVIADDHPLFRSALKQAINTCIPNTQLLEACNFSELISLIEQTPTLEIIFLDLYMPGNNGFTGLTQLQNHYPDLTVIMVSSDENPQIMKTALDFGASAFIPKSANLETINQAINTVINGETWLPEGVDFSSLDTVETSHQKLAQQLMELTPQQYTVLSMIADGQLNKQIAYELDIKETTVKKHVSAILVKLGVNNRTLAGLAFQQLKLLSTENTSE